MGSRDPWGLIKGLSPAHRQCRSTLPVLPHFFEVSAVRNTTVTFRRETEAWSRNLPRVTEYPIRARRRPEVTEPRPLLLRVGERLEERGPRRSFHPAEERGRGLLNSQARIHTGLAAGPWLGPCSENLGGEGLHQAHVLDTAPAEPSSEPVRDAEPLPRRWQAGCTAWPCLPWQRDLGRLLPPWPP